MNFPGRILLTCAALAFAFVGCTSSDTAHGLVPDATPQSELARFVQEQRAAAESWDSRYGESEPVRIDPDDVARLRALGYLQ